MQKKIKKCAHCKVDFNIKDKNRIVLELWKDKKHLTRLYFCSKNCFVSFLKDKKVI
ncbi:MAG TPA: hypothetical protein P5140_03285 [Methanofastidiosum sp.]|nr:hypothetical protein [Methanofastidiosum sp.]HPC81503.1 hypothetical protein [Methanofastidiosum sp.]HRS25556.1 hypothetical protein [Methanofastidiosum sp.]